MDRRPATELLALLLAAGALLASYLQTRAAMRLVREAMRMAQGPRPPEARPAATVPETPTPEQAQAAFRADLEQLAAARDALAPSMRAEVTALQWSTEAGAAGAAGLRVQNAGPATALELTAEVRLEDGSFHRGTVDMLAAGDVFRFADEMREFAPGVLDDPPPALGQVAARLTWMNEDGTVDSTDWVVVERG